METSQETPDEPDENEPSNTESVLYQCAAENTGHFMSEWQKANQEVSHLLNRNAEIVVRATKLRQCDIPSMNFQPDIDGIVVELTSFAGITFPLTHISILRNDFNSLESIYPKLKKHLDLRHYSEKTLSVLSQCKGTEISIEGPWHIWLGVVPLPGTVFQQIRFLNMTKVTFDYIKSVGTTLKCKVAGAALAGRARNTFMKVDLHSVKHWTIMPDECMDVLKLLQVAVDEVQFVQFYGDIPHRRPHLNIYHPVSGIIVCGDVINKATREALERAIEPYIFSFDQNVNLLRDLRCRMEFVVEVPSVPHVITPHMYVSLPNIERLLQKYDLLVPYVNADDSILSSLRSVGTQMIERLRNLYDEYRLTGDSTATWEAYSLELCLEKMLWGKPASPVSSKLAVEIGPCASVLPGSCVDFVHHLQGQPNAPYKGVSIGKMSLEDVAMSLMAMVSPRASKVCTRMIEFLILADLQLQDVLLSGIIENQLVRFTVIQTWDTAGHKTFKLIPNKFVELCSPDGSDKDEAERLTTAIIQQLEMRQLVYARKFIYLRGTSFPWIIPVRDKLDNRKKRLNARQLLDTLTFISCVALIQQQWFVNFQNIEPMLATLPVNQFTMQMLDILGKINLSFVGTLKIRRLHKSIPFQLPKDTAIATTAEKQEVENPKPIEESEDVNHIQDVVENCEEDTQCQDVEKTPTTHLPMAVKTF
ncbi:Hypothetical predicted protein [Mytilus galloprovincialis]|uniref:Uncharacterized protein n=1 Tax=Mytilus galloprovincialis TaxID=29158 RepID=A0A8B6DJW5_MYTGA|nr:Hypothetical predicted protein [Mytilus galloprovincialis]